MNRLVIVVATAIVIVITGSIIFIASWPPDPPRPPQPGPEASDEETAEIGDDSPGFRQPKEPRIVQPTPPTQSETGTGTVSVSINAIPWARVFIKLPENDHFMEPRSRDFTIPPEPHGRDSNVTPIPGDLKVPIGTTIKLIYRGNEKIFRYEEWKDGGTISHDFMNQ